jgi:hypothetical protein
MAQEVNPNNCKADCGEEKIPPLQHSIDSDLGGPLPSAGDAADFCTGKAGAGGVFCDF